MIAPKRQAPNLMNFRNPRFIHSRQERPMIVSRRPYFPKPDNISFAVQIVGALIVIVLLTLTIVSAELYFGGGLTNISNLNEDPGIGPQASASSWH
jgi:hypothetical protein